MWRVVRHVCEHFRNYFRPNPDFKSRFRNPDFLVEIRKSCTAARGVLRFHRTVVTTHMRLTVTCERPPPEVKIRHSPDSEFRIRIPNPDSESEFQIRETPPTSRAR